MRHMMPKEILDAVDLQPQYRTFSEILDSLLQQARQRADVYVGDVCHSTRKVGTVTPRVSANMNDPPATKTTTPVPTDISQLSSNVSKTETEEQESASYQYEQEQECDGDEAFCRQGEGQRWFQKNLFQMWNERTKQIDAGRKEKEKEARETGRTEKVDPNEKDGPKENSQTLVTRGTTFGTIHIGTEKRTVLKWIRGRLLNQFHISVQSV